MLDFLDWMLYEYLELFKNATSTQCDVYLAALSHNDQNFVKQSKEMNLSRFRRDDLQKQNLHCSVWHFVL